MPERVRIHPEIEHALRQGEPLVALETAVVTAGLPRDPVTPNQSDRLGFDSHENLPLNLALARAMDRTVRAMGATPATVAVIDGVLHIGLDPAELERLAHHPQAGKTSAGDLAATLALGRTAGTTVSATLLACRLAGARLGTRPISVFATGGIGGVHRGWTDRPDISADLLEIASTPTCIVCAGAKSILDLPATLEALETLRVPVIGYRSDWFAQFLSRGDEPGLDRLPVPTRVEAIAEVAEICRTHWRALDRESAVLLSVPVPAADAMDPAHLQAAVEQAEREAAAAGRRAADRTPHVLASLARLTAGRSLGANLSLLQQNAAVAAELALALIAAERR